MADRTIDINIVAHDYATGVFRNVTTGLGNFQASLNSGFGRANYVFRTFNNAMRGISNTAVSALKTAGTAVYNFTKDSIVQFAELESTMARTMGVLATGYNFNWNNIRNGNTNPTDVAEYARFQQDHTALTQQTYRLATSGPSGMGSFYNPAEIAEAQYELSKGGITAEQMLANNDELVNAVTVFAGANDLSMGNAVAYGIQLAAQYEKGTGDWAEMFDMVTWAANQTPNTSVEDMMQALQKVGNVAHGYGVSLEDTLTSLIIMGHSGLKGSQAGSGLATTLTRGISPTGISTAGAPPTEHVEELYNQFKDNIVNEDGMFVGMENYIDMLSEIENQLSDQEMAWFNKKLFGLYQTKTALALSKDLGDDTDETNIFARLSEQLATQSEDSNQLIYDMVLESTSGQLEALQNAWDATKMRVGEALSPVTLKITKELRKGLETGDFSNFDWDGIRAAVDEAAANIEGLFGPDAADLMLRIADFIRSVGDFLINAGQVAGAEAPLIGASFEALVKLLNGDFSGAWDTFTQGIEDTNAAIEELPEELQGAANAAKNLILMFEGLLALNLVTKVGEVVTAFGGMVTAFNLWKGISSFNKNVGSLGGALTNSNINANYVNVNTGNTTFGSVGNMTVASAPLVNINASVVNVYGGLVNSLGGGGSGLGNLLGGGGGLPLLGGGGGLALAGAGGLALAGGGGLLALGGQALNGLLALPGAIGGSGAIPALTAGAEAAGAASSFWLPGATSQVLNADGTIAATYFGNMSGSQILAAAGKAMGLLGSVSMLLSLSGSSANMESIYSDWTRDAMEQGYTGEALRQYLVENANPGWINNPSLSEDERRELAGRNIGEWYDSMIKGSAYMQSAEGMQDLYDAMVAQIEGDGKLTESFFNNFFTSRGIAGSQEIIETMFSNMFNDEYSRPWIYAGSYADDSLTTFFRNNINNTKDWSQYGTLAQVMAALNGKLDNLSYVTGSDNIYKNQYGEYFKFLNDGTLQNITEEFNRAVNGVDNASLSLQNAVETLINHPEIMGYESATKEDAINFIATTLGLDPVMLSTLNSLNISLDSLVQAVANGISDPELKAAFLEAWGNFESTIAADMQSVSGNVISIQEAVRMLADSSPGWVLGLGQGPLSSDGAYNYVMGQIADGQLANSGLLSSILNGITALDPSLTVDITNSAPQVNVDVKVNVAPSGAITKNIITSYGAIDNWMYRNSQRYGSIVNIQR